MNREDFTDEERALLGEWKVAEPAPGLSARVLEADDRRRSRARWRVVGAAAGMAVAASAALFFFAGHAPIEGEARAVDRRTVLIGARATAVLESGADLSYRVARSGDAELTQRAGDVFYRVERGGAFVVHTPNGEVRVLGTCFRVEVKEMRASIAGLAGAAAGALVATTVMVTVYEGQVVTASPEGSARTLSAGESAELPAPREPPSKRALVERSEGSPPHDSRIPLEDLPANASPEEMAVAHRALKKEAEKLRAELDALRSVAEEAQRAKQASRIYDLDQATLLELAEKCELRWDMQSLGAKADGLNPKKADRLRLSQEEVATVNQVMAEDHARILKELGALYAEVTGDTASGSLAPSAMFEELVDKAPKGEVQRVYARLARERAGLMAPNDAAGRSPWERLFRLMTTAGDDLETALAKELGPETARELRALDEGWGSRSRSSMGCPEGQ